ncbi:MAG: hypothetical protein V1847_00710 [Candidatus Diapherotrites archaeon]
MPLEYRTRNLKRVTIHEWPAVRKNNENKLPVPTSILEDLYYRGEGRNATLFRKEYTYKGEKYLAWFGYSGSYEGNKNFGTFRIRKGSHTYFVKIAKSRDALKCINGTINAQNALKEMPETTEGFRIQIIPPLYVVENKLKDRCAIVTASLPEKYFSQLETVSSYDEVGKKARKVITSLFDKFFDKGVVDVFPRNAFLHRKTNTIFLYDLEAME